LIFLSPKLLIHVYGVTGSVKTTGIDAIKVILGKYYAYGKDGQLFSGEDDLGFLAGMQNISFVLYDEIPTDQGIKDNKAKKLGNGIDDIVAREFFEAGTSLKSYRTVFTTSQDKPEYKTTTLEGLNSRIAFLDMSDVAYTNEKHKLRKPKYYKKDSYFASTQFRENNKHQLFWLLIIYLLLYFKFNEDKILYSKQLIYNKIQLASLLPKYYTFIKEFIKYTGNSNDKVKLNKIVNEYCNETYTEGKEQNKEKIKKSLNSYLENCFSDIYDDDDQVLNKFSDNFLFIC